jgi:hypothetical protein
MVEDAHASSFLGAAPGGGALMAGRLTRFLNLERPHRPGEAPPHEVATKARFTGETSGMVLSPDLGEQPFLRCPRCEADNSRYAERCFNCQDVLTGEDVRAWNEQLWTRRQEEAAREQQQGQIPTEQDLLRQNRMLGEALAREVAEKERARLSWWSGGNANDFTPAGVRLLRLLPTTRARALAGAAAVAGFFGAAIVAFLARKHPMLQGGALVVALLLLALFTPNARYRRWWW